MEKESNLKIAVAGTGYVGLLLRTRCQECKGVHAKIIIEACASTRNKV